MHFHDRYVDQKIAVLDGIGDAVGRAGAKSADPARAARVVSGRGRAGGRAHVRIPFCTALGWARSPTDDVVLARGGRLG